MEETQIMNLLEEVAPATREWIIKEQVLPPGAVVEGELYKDFKKTYCRNKTGSAIEARAEFFRDWTEEGKGVVRVYRDENHSPSRGAAIATWTSTLLRWISWADDSCRGEEQKQQQQQQQQQKQQQQQQQ